MTAIKVTKEEEFHNKFGKYKHDDMVGKQFGTKVSQAGTSTFPPAHNV
jgi:tRNA A58 N-methylase Trm61